jgi:prepilin-type N-terminal cleavage/methylation domain-containing protein
MKRLSSGFTLIETLIATAILVVASTAVASLFVSSLQTNLNNQDRTIAGLLLSDKLEQFSVLPFTDTSWAAGHYSEYVSIAADGSVIISTNPTAKYVRTWQISATTVRSLTVIIYTNHSPVSGRQTELIRATLTEAARW